MNDMSNLNVIDILKDFTDINTSELNGRKFRCPSHDHQDENPSAEINEKYNTVKCWSKCGTMRPVELLAKIKDISEDEAERILIDHYNLRPLTAEEEAEKYKKSLLEKYINECYQNLNEEHLEALHNRGLEDKTIEELKVGYHDPDNTSLTEEDLIELGVAFRRGGNLQSNFAGKIIIPLYKNTPNCPGYFLAWDYKGGDIKYIFPSGWTKPLVGDITDNTILVEGVFDYLSLKQAGFKCTPILGSMLSRTQKEQLSKLNNFYIMLDGDEAGRKAAVKIAEEFCTTSEIINLNEVDPNDLYLNSSSMEDFKVQINEKIGTSKNIIEFKITKFKNMDNSLKSINYFKKHIAPLLNKYDPAGREYYISILGKMKTETGLNIGAIRETLDENDKLKSAGGGNPTDSLKIYEEFRKEFSLYRDQLHGYYAKFDYKGSTKLLNIRSEEFKEYAFVRLRQLTSGLPSQDYVKKFLDNLSSEAGNVGVEVELKNRVCKDDNGVFYYDLSNKDGKIIKVEKGSWEIEQNDNPLFVKEEHQKPQMEPANEGDISKIFDLFNQFNKEQEILLSCYLPFTLVPDSPKPILFIQGEKGAGKTDFSRFIRTLIDPSILKSLKEPRKEKDTVQQLAHHYCCLYDNINDVRPWFIRLACTAVTGEYDERRKLFTDEGSQFFSYQRVLIINAINRLGMDYSDFQDRLLLIKMQRIGGEKRLTRTDVDRKIEELRPIVFGGMVKALAEAKKIVNDINIETLPRMADFMIWGAAIAEVLGFGKRAFIDAYNNNMNDINLEMLENDSLAMTVLEFIEEEKQFKGPASELLQELEDVAIDLHINTKRNDWPGSPSILSRKLNEIKSNLYDNGIIFEKGRESGDNSSRYIELKPVQKDNNIPELKTVTQAGSI